MSKALSLDLRVRVLAAVAAGLSHRAAAARFGVSAASVSRATMPIARPSIDTPASGRWASVTALQRFLMRHGMARRRLAMPASRTARTCLPGAGHGATARRSSIRPAWCLSMRPGPRPTWPVPTAARRAASACGFARDRRPSRADIEETPRGRRGSTQVGSRPPVPNSSSCRPTLPTKWPSPSSRRCSARPQSAPSRGCGMQSAASSKPSNPRNAETTSPPQAMDRIPL